MIVIGQPGSRSTATTNSANSPMNWLHACVFLAIILSGPVRAEVPFGWIGNGHTNAYALQAWTFELSGSLAAVNETIDVFNFRERLLTGNQRLVGNTGDLKGSSGELRLGVWPSLELFYRESEQELTVNLGEISSADIENLDGVLFSQRQAYGAKWVFYDAVNQDLAYPWTSVALEFTRTRNRSRDFGGDLAGISTSPTSGVFFDPPSRFALDRLQDDGWQARLLVSQALGASSTATLWAGVGKATASSGTRWDVDIAVLRDAFFQTFDSEETQFRVGASVNWQYFPRMPVQVGYEFIEIAERSQLIQRGSSSFSRYLPGFLRGDNLADGVTRNHALYGSINWWLNPNIYISGVGKLLSNQFTGVIPHYNNPLSGSFADVPYGYVEVKLGFRFAGIE